MPTSDKKKRWRFIKGTANCLISFSPDDFANLEYLKGLSNDENKKNEIDGLRAFLICFSIFKSSSITSAFVIIPFIYLLIAA